MSAALAYHFDQEESFGAANDNTLSASSIVIKMSVASRNGHYSHNVAALAAAPFSLSFIPRMNDLAIERYRAPCQTLNARLQPYTLKVSNGSSLLQDMQYNYDKNGRVQYQTNHLNTEDTRYYQYDSVGRLKQANSATWGQAEYSYDALGNLRKKYFSGWNGSGPRTVTNNYNSRNRIVSSIDTSNISYGFGYDTRGNIRLTGLLNFTYDMSDQPVAMSGRAPNTGTQIDGTYLYDGNMKRVKSVVNGKTIYNVYDAAGRLVHVDEVGGGETDYLHGMGQTLARIKDGEFTYLHPDHLGSPQVGTNEAGAVAFNEYYTPFGEALINAAANDNQSGFTGHIKDKSTGLNYMQARYYDPNVGRFLSIDPVTFMDTGNPNFFNRYAYTFNDPINLIDPDGSAPNKAGATDYGTIQRNIMSTGNLSGLTNNTGNSNRYFHTGTYGWVDTRHFGRAAGLTNGPLTGGMVKFLGAGQEVMQYIDETVNGLNYKSGFSPEDIPSNSAGVAFARFSSKYMGKNSGASLADAFAAWAKKEGAATPLTGEFKSAWDSLPTSDPSVRGGGGRGSNSTSTVGPNSSVKANSAASASTSNSAATSHCRGSRIGNNGSGSIC